MRLFFSLGIRWYQVTVFLSFILFYLFWKRHIWLWSLDHLLWASFFYVIYLGDILMILFNWRKANLHFFLLIFTSLFQNIDVFVYQIIIQDTPLLCIFSFIKHIFDLQLIQTITQLFYVFFLIWIINWSLMPISWFLLLVVYKSIVEVI